MTTCDPDNLSTDSADDTFDYLFKIVLVGDCGTGKTCIVRKFRTGNFIESNCMTIGVDFSMKTVIVDDKKVKLQIWDTAGSERFRSITQNYYRSANGVILVYDITQRSSFESLQKWIEEIRRHTTMNFPLILLGNKCDLESSREVSKSEAEAICQYVPELYRIVETSAKENTNLDSIFYCLAVELKRRYEDGQFTVTTEKENIIELEKKERNLSSCSFCSYKPS